MLEGVEDLTLGQLNAVTQAWVELEYNRKLHSELGCAPIQRCLEGPAAEMEEASDWRPERRVKT